jgi:3-oxoacyl-[acyl-carrier protein] reductase
MKALMFDGNGNRTQDAGFSNREDLCGRTAVVTGSSGGIGRAIALALAHAGAAVLIHGRSNHAAANAVAQSITEVPGQSTVLLWDLGESSQLAEFVAQAWRWRGDVDIWINNAGADVLTGEEGHWSFDQKLERLWQVDVRATVSLSRLVGKRMQEQVDKRGRGVIINIGWDQVEHGMAGDSGQMFGTVKGAVMAFTKSLAQSFAPDVRVNCVAPGWIKTSWGEQADSYWQNRACRESLLGRWGTPEDVANVVRFLSSPAAEFITGQTIPVNGGFRYGDPDPAIAKSPKSPKNPKN